MLDNTTGEFKGVLGQDFSRNIWCILGLPFDAIDMQGAVDRVVLAASKKTSYFISTPNLNFLCTAQSDIDFRQSVINSDLSVPDGMPIIWLARLLNIPIFERVAGSSLINRLSIRVTDEPIKIFFFGGELGVAKQASLKLNELNAGIVSVGYYDPGFVAVENMSTEEIITELNSYDMDFIVVSLGAQKGQAWIEKNRHKLNAPVTSHLGAVVNFYAGTVKRAPEWMQRKGVEWLWRIFQEPSLWRRYFDDGIQLLKMLVLYVFPYWIYSMLNKPLSITKTLEVEVKPEGGARLILITGNCCWQNNEPLRSIFKQSVIENKDVIIDLKAVIWVDASFIGLCLLLHKHLRENGKIVSLVNANKAIKKIIRWNRVEYLLKN